MQDPHSHKLALNWQARQRESLKFWMSVEAGRSAARAYRAHQQRGSRRAYEYASGIIENLDDRDYKTAAQKEFDHAVSLLLENDSSEIIS